MILEGYVHHFDEVVAASTAANLVVIMNSHTNSASWCCSATDGNGVWNDKHYSTHDWLQALTIVATRYRNNSMVVGIDVKNEVHNTREQTVTWRGSDSPDTDWKVASQLAASAVHAVNADMLIFVQGMCYATELSDLYRYPPTFNLSSSKLVLVAHIYAWSYWSLLLQERYYMSSWWPYALACNVILFYMLLCQMRLCTCTHHVLIDSIFVWSLLTATCMMAYASIVSQSGCSVPVDAGAFNFFAMLSGLMSMVKTRHAYTRCTLWCTVYLVGIGVATLALGLSAMSTNGMLFDVNVRDSIDTPHRSIPLFLGEFGTNRYRTVTDSQYLHDVIQYLQQEDLSWAYWALNGDRWSQTEHKYVGEDFGLFDETWTEISESRLSALHT
jgi:hypothetical protein